MIQKEITTVASDFDGTLLLHGKLQVEDELFELVRRLQEAGILFIAASGRQYANLRRLMAPIADEISYICENGALVVSENKVLYKSTIETGLAYELIDDMRRIFGTELLVSGENTCYIAPNNMENARMLRDVVKNTVTVVEDYNDIEDDMIKISIYWKTGIPDAVARSFHEKYDDRLHIVDGGNGWLDFTNLGTDKGAALKILAKEKGFRMDEILSFGDSENDMTMLKETGYSFAMDTAKEHVKACSNATCAAVEPVLRRLLEGKTELDGFRAKVSLR